MSETPKPHISPTATDQESLEYASEIAHNLVGGTYRSVPSYELRLAKAVIRLEEQLEAAQRTAQHNFDHATQMDHRAQRAETTLERIAYAGQPESINSYGEAITAARETLDSNPASSQERG